MTQGRIEPLREGGKGLSCGCLNLSLELAEILFRNAGWIDVDFSWLIKQWGYRGGAVGASAATHDGGGVCDVAWSLVDTDRKLAAWFEAGIIPMPRNWVGNRHGHMLVYGCDGHMHPQAEAQVRSYLRGMDGLANESRYPGPWQTPITWEAARKKHANLLEDPMPTAKDVWNVPIDANGKDAAWYEISTRESVLIVGRRTQAMNDKLDEQAAAIEKLTAAVAALANKVGGQP